MSQPDPGAVRGALAALLDVPEAGLAGAARALLTPDCAWHVSDPWAPFTGPEAVVEGFVRPLRRALSGAHRRDEIFIAGPNRRAAGGDWAAAVTHYVGQHDAALGPAPPSGRLAFLRAGEFYRLEGARIAEARIILDLPDLMRQAGRLPLPPMLGTEMLFPGPATHDGILPADGGEGARSLDVMEAMMRDLHAYDPATFASDRQTEAGGYWHPRMMWYGPGGIGATYRWQGFVDHHRRAFLTAFPDRRGGNHYARIGQGAYAAAGGWPSMTMTHAGDYLGVPATGRRLTLRVMDFYRMQDGQIAENWVCLDYMDLFRQMGVDLGAPAAAA